jgi:diamine N-acetyltransferase
MNLSLADVFTQPHLATYTIDLPDLSTNGKAYLRPLKPDDVDKLAILLAGLSPETRRFKYFPTYDKATAKTLCEGIDRFDKLLLVAELSSSQELIGVFEFSFDISDDDMQRFQRYGISLDARSDCRIDLALADAYQSKGVGSIVFPMLVDIAKRFGKNRIVLWGGVFSDNPRAIKFYEKHGFRRAGTFADYYGRQSLDMILEVA